MRHDEEDDGAQAIIMIRRMFGYIFCLFFFKEKDIFLILIFDNHFIPYIFLLVYSLSKGS